MSNKLFSKDRQNLNIQIDDQSDEEASLFGASMRFECGDREMNFLLLRIITDTVAII
jgi:hypothetical protein